MKNVCYKRERVGIFLRVLISVGAAQIGYAGELGLLYGKVVEKGTERPIPGVTLLLEPTQETALTDDAGRFSYPPLPAGEYRLLAVAINYKKPEPVTLFIKAGETTDPVLYLEKEFISMLEIVVETERKQPDPVRETVRTEEIRKIPGASGDIVVATQNLPGVTAASTNAYAGSFLARGSGPYDNTILLDQMPIFFPLHTFGFISTLNSRFIRSVDFYAGGFGARYGNAMGAVMDITTRDLTTRKIETELDISAAMLQGSVEGPIGVNSHFFVAGRRGLLEYLPLSESGTTIIPRFNDYQAKWTLRPSEAYTVNLLLFGSRDEFSFATETPDNRDPSFTQLTTKTAFDNQGVTIQSHLSPNHTMTLALFTHQSAETIILGHDTSLDVGVKEVRSKGDFEYTTSAHKLGYGYEVGYGRYRVNGTSIRLCPEGDPACNFTDSERITTAIHDSGYGTAFYMEDTRYLTPQLDLTYGGRVDYFSPTSALDWSPRLSALVHIDPDQRLKVAYGHYWQWPNRQGEFTEGFGNPKIGSNRAIHYVAGYEKGLTPAISLDLQAYYKAFDHLIVPSDDPKLVLDNDGIGYAKGAEILIRHRLVDRFFGWVAYSRSTSLRKNREGEPWRISDYNRPDVFTLLGSYQMTQRVNGGLRFRYVSGAPYTPIVGTRQDAGRVFPIYGGINTRHLPASYTLDVRWEYKKRYDQWILTGYVEIWNLTNRKNPVGITYKDNFTGQEFITEPGIIPFMGIMADF